MSRSTSLIEWLPDDFIVHSRDPAHQMVHLDDLNMESDSFYGRPNTISSVLFLIVISSSTTRLIRWYVVALRGLVLKGMVHRRVWLEALQFLARSLRALLLVLNLWHQDAETAIVTPSALMARLRPLCMASYRFPAMRIFVRCVPLWHWQRTIT
jgi:hypothetical protein